MRQIHVERLVGQRASEAEVEIVERKGLGHPDTLCDLVGEAISRALCRVYLARFGRILHHNCDKALLAAGRVEHRLGGGRVLEPMRLILGDRATERCQGVTIEVPEIAVAAARDCLRRILPEVDPERHVTFQVEIRPGSEELSGIFAPGAVLGANDTSAAVGYAPLTETETVVLETERFLNSLSFKARFEGTGQDVKVMGLRAGRDLTLVVAMPFFDRLLAREADYWERKREVEEELRGQVRRWGPNIEGLTLLLNHLDQPGAGLSGMYLTVLGTSAESADSGQIGRGNRANGVISLNRPGGAEATAGKNPVSHVGKIYNVLAYRLADRIHRERPEIREAVVRLCSRIGDPVDHPAMISIQVDLQPGATLSQVRAGILSVVEQELDGIPALCSALAAGEFDVC